MPLWLTTLITGLLLLAAGAALLLKGKTCQAPLFTFIRSDIAGILTMGLGGTWFLYKVLTLSPADNLFGFDFQLFKLILLFLFGGSVVGSFFFLKDFLSVRGTAVIGLLWAHLCLGSAYGLYEVPARLVLVTVCYLFIVLFIYMGASPFRLRDLLEWTYRSPQRVRALGATLSVLGLANCLALLGYA